MTKINMLKAGVATLTLFSAAVSAEVLYFQDFDGGSMGGVSNSAYTVASKVDGSTDTNWRVHNGSGTTAGAKPGTYTSATGNMVGHNAFYKDKERSIFTFSVDATGFKDLNLMFDWGAIFRTDANNYDGASIIAYTGALNTSTTGNLSKVGNPVLLATGGAFNTPTDRFGYLSDAQYGGGFDNTAPGALGIGSLAYQGGTAMFDLTGLGFDNQVVNFRLAFGSSNSSNSDGINFDNFKVQGNCINGGSGSTCDSGSEPPGGGQVPEPGTLALAMLGMVAAFRSRKQSV